MMSCLHQSAKFWRQCTSETSLRRIHGSNHESLVLPNVIDFCLFVKPNSISKLSVGSYPFLTALDSPPIVRKHRLRLLTTSVHDVHLRLVCMVSTHVRIQGSLTDFYPCIAIISPKSTSFDHIIMHALLTARFPKRCEIDPSRSLRVLNTSILNSWIKAF
jgi:hypothetical protein